MNREEIEKQIQKEMNDFLDTPFAEPLPEWFLENFNDAVMHLPQHLIPYRAELIQSITNKKDLADLTVREVGFIVQMCLSVPPIIIAKNVTKFILKKYALETVYVKYDKARDKEQERLFRKTASFGKGSGILHATHIPDELKQKH